MLQNVSASSNAPYVWDEKTVYDSGMDFLRQKKEIINIYENLEGYVYSSSSRENKDKLNNIAFNSINEIKQLHDVAIELFCTKSTQNYFLKKEAELLSKIAIASQFAMKYFESRDRARAYRGERFPCPSRIVADQEQVKKWKKEFELAVSS